MVPLVEKSSFTWLVTYLDAAGTLLISP